MVRYQSNQNVKNKLEQNQLSSKRNDRLRTNRNLRNKTETILKTNMTRSSEVNETKSRLKRKLLVYKKDDKFYIDHMAAYALKITSVRAVMLENPHLVEVNLETLYKFQNNEDIEIEYQELNKEKEITTREGELAETLEELEQEKYGIGLHGIDIGDSVEKQSKASNISSEGLNINNNSKTILSTAISLGTNEDAQQLSQDITKYKFGNGTKATVVIAVPLYIQNENGEKIFLGFPEKNKRTAGQQYEEHCILDRICGKLGKVPPEFILGYYCEDSDGSEKFIKNSKHYSNITQEERKNLYKELYLSMDDISRSINELIASKNIEQLCQMKEKLKQLDMNTYMVDNAMGLIQEYKEQEKDQVKEKNIRKVILDDVQPNETPLNSTKSKSQKTRRILLDVCNEAKLSDLTMAKDILKEGIKEQEKDQVKGKNIRKVILDDVQPNETPLNSTESKSKKIRKILLDVCNEAKLSDLTMAKGILKEGIKEQEKNYEGKEV